MARTDSRKRQQERRNHHNRLANRRRLRELKKQASPTEPNAAPAS